MGAAWSCDTHRFKGEFAFSASFRQASGKLSGMAFAFEKPHLLTPKTIRKSLPKCLPMPPFEASLKVGPGGGRGVILGVIWGGHLTTLKSLSVWGTQIPGKLPGKLTGNFPEWTFHLRNPTYSRALLPRMTLVARQTPSNYIQGARVPRLTHT